MAMTDLENAQRFGAMLAKSRTDAGKTQKYMAQALGKSVNTIQNWESGVGEPGYRTLEKWFDALGINMELYILNYKYRNHFDMQDSNIQKIKDCVHTYINNQCSERDIRQLAFCMFGNTGSSFHEQLNMLTANNHCTMRSRVNVCQLIMDNFTMEQAHEELVRSDQVMPDVETLKNALTKGRSAAYAGENGYTLISVKNEK